jgi:hypothetical protein
MWNNRLMTTINSLRKEEAFKQLKKARLEIKGLAKGCFYYPVPQCSITLGQARFGGGLG